MNRKKLIIIISAIVICALTYAVNPAGIYNGINGLNRNQPSFKRTDESYKLSFIPSRSPSGTMNVYVPEYITTDLETVKYCALRFGMGECVVTEDDDTFLISRESEELKIHRNMGLFEYTNQKKDSQKKLSGDEEAVNTVVEFLAANHIYLSYEEVKVLRNDSSYNLTFIERLGNLKNYAFPQTAVIDEYGNIEKIYYYFIDYKKIGSSKIKSMEDAYLELPEFTDSTKIDLQKGQLVYFYENSIIQAAYLFEGEIATGKVFECFIKASVY